MKKLNYIALFIVASMVLVLSCTKETESSETSEGTVTISLSIENELKSALDLNEEQVPESVFISIKDSEQNYVYNLYELVLIKVGEEYVTEELELVIGEYTVDDFIVVDSAEAAIYITPKTGSEFEALVNNPLSYGFEVKASETTSLIMEVIDANLGDAVDFGYATFSFTVVNTLEKGLLAYFPFNGTLTDSSDNSHELIDSTQSSYAEGVNGDALYFDGESDYLIFPEELKFLPLSSSTLSFWIKTEQTSRFDLFNQRTGSFSTDKFNHGLIFNRDEIAGLDVRYPGYNDGTEFSVDMNISSNSWESIILVKDVSDSTLTLYRSGLKVYEKSGADSDFIIQGDLLLGKDYYNSHYFEGLIDEVRIFDRALTDTEVLKLYNL